MLHHHGQLAEIHHRKREPAGRTLWDQTSHSREQQSETDLSHFIVMGRSCLARISSCVWKACTTQNGVNPQKIAVARLQSNLEARRGQFDAQRLSEILHDAQQVRPRQRKQRSGLVIRVRSRRVLPREQAGHRPASTSTAAATGASNVRSSTPRCPGTASTTCAARSTCTRSGTRLGSGRQSIHGARCCGRSSACACTRASP